MKTRIFFENTDAVTKLNFDAEFLGLVNLLLWLKGIKKKKIDVLQNDVN